MGRAVTWYWEKQPIAVVNEDPFLSGTYYTCLDTTEYVKILSIATRQINDETDGKSINLRTTLEGITGTNYAYVENNNTWYYWYRHQISEGNVHGLSIRMYGYYSPLPYRSAKIEVRSASALGTNPELDCRIQYAIRKEV